MQLDKNFTAKGKGLMKCVDIVHGEQYMCQHTSACISYKKNKKKSHVFMSLKNNDNLYSHS